MMFSHRAALAVLLACLTGCATSPADETSTLRESVTAAPVESAAQEGPELGPDRTASGLFMAGAGALRQGRAKDATLYFDRAAQIAPAEEQPFLREQAFSAAVLAGDIERAAGMAPTDAEAGAYRLGRLVIAVDKLAGNDGQGAYEMLSGEAFGPTHRAVADMLLPWAAIAAGKPQAASARRLATDSPQLALTGLNQALVLEVAGQPAQAGPIYAAIADRVSGLAPFTLAYGAFLERQDMRAEAVALYDAFLRNGPGDAGVTTARARAAARRPAAPPLPTVRQGAGQAMLIAGMVAMNQRDVPSGISYMHLALRLDPNRSDALLVTGDVLSQSKQATAARAIYGRIPTSSPEYINAQARIIASYQSEGDAEGALRAARDLVRTAPKQPGPQVLLADVLRSAKDYKGSAAALDRVIAMRGKSAEWNLYYARAVSHDLAGDWRKAEKDLLRAHALAPEEPDVLNYLGYSWANRGERLQEALALLQKAAARDPNSGAVIDSLGWAYFRVGDYDEAVENLERAVELAPSAPDINDHLGDVYAKVGRTLEARYQWLRVLTLEADDELRAKVQAKIDATPEPAPIVGASLAPETASLVPEIAAP